MIFRNFCQEFINDQTSIILKIAKKSCSYYQHTPSQIKQLISSFKRSKSQWAEYQKMKELFDSEQA